ncbi:putative amino acid permease family protein [Leptodontidium sp. MPI-SDFR-AT-0119]|nr:putative amino acid permease family protein [Leptodontidium sp. MPI-SDFR-AT-0119]
MVKHNIVTKDSGSARSVTWGSDEQVLADLGFQIELTRKFGRLSMLAMAFGILGTWIAFAASFGTGLTYGGPVTMLYGLLIETFSVYCTAASMAEILSVYPTNLGQAFWILQLAEGRPWAKLFSYITAWINMVGWWSLIGSSSVYSVNFFLAIINLYHADFVFQTWHYFIIFEATIWITALINMGAARHDKILPWFNNILLFANLATFLCLLVGLLVSTGKNGSFQPASFVFGGWNNFTGWPNGLVFFLGFIQAAYGLTAFDSVIHMIEELPNPTINGPKSMIWAIWVGAGTGAIFLVVCLFCIQNLEEVINTPSGLPFVQIMLDVLGTRGTAAGLISIQIQAVIGGVSITTAASRLTFALARDHGIPFGNYFARISPYWKMPVRATFGQTCIVSLLGILFFISDQVLTAVLALASITLNIACVLPILCLMIVGRSRLQYPRPYSLGRRGYIFNIIAICNSLICTTLFFFPSSPNPGTTGMNWAIAAFGVLCLFSLVSWFAVGRKQYGIVVVVEGQ